MKIKVFMIGIVFLAFGIVAFYFSAMASQAYTGMGVWWQWWQYFLMDSGRPSPLHNATTVMLVSLEFIVIGLGFTINSVVAKPKTATSSVSSTSL